MSLLSQVFAGATSGITGRKGLEDWKHASNVFASNDLFRAPKFKGMFHVSFVFNDWSAETTIVDGESTISPQKSFNQIMNGGTNRSDVLSVLTKTIDLPKFNVQYSTHNQYNKTTHTYKKMKYDPITITFHDDMSDYVWGLWAFYYNWYFSDGIKGYSSPLTDKNDVTTIFANAQKAIKDTVRNIYRAITGNNQFQELPPVASRPGTEWDTASKIPSLIGIGSIPNQWTSDAWGLNGSVYQQQSTADAALHLLKAIEIYPLGSKKASVMILHNPKIVSWDHDTFDYSAGAQTATCRLQLVYEGVTYRDQINAETVMNTISFFDKHASPLMSGAPRTLLGPGGIFDRTIGIVGNIMNGNVSVNDIFNAVSVSRGIADKKLRQGTGAELTNSVVNSIQSASTAAPINKTFPGTG